MEITFAILDKNNIVINLIVMSDPIDYSLLQDIVKNSNGEYCIRYNINYDEYQINIDNLVRYNLINSNPIIGYEFSNNLFFPPKPYDDWIWNPIYHEWAPPLPQGSIEEVYVWNPDSQSWEIQNNE